MRIIVNRAALVRALAFTGLTRASRPVIPVLGGTRLTVGPAGVTLAVFDYAESATTTVPAADGTAWVAGEMLADGTALVKAVKALPKVTGKAAKTATVTLEMQAAGDGMPDGTLTVQGEGVTLTVPGLPIADYPTLPELPPVAGVIAGDVFARSVTRVARAAGTDGTLPVLMCVQVETGSDGLTLAATDRYRLVVDAVDWTPASADSETVTVLIPARTLTGWVKHADTDGKITLHLATEADEAGTRLAALSDGIHTMTLRTSGGEFLPYQRLMRDVSGNTSTLTVDAGALASAVTRAGQVSERNMPVLVTAETDTVTVRANNGTTDTYAQTVPATVTGPAIDYRFNAGYLASMLAGVDGRAIVGFHTVTETDGLGKPAVRVKPTAIYPVDGPDPFRAMVCNIRKP